jgi:SpoIID/LytB domain protein
MRRAVWCSSALVVLLFVGLTDRVEATTTGGDLTFEGSGWGHGVGLSQYGARAMADGGASSPEILDHYFPGTALRHLDTLSAGNEVLTIEAPLWVGLLQNRSEVTFVIEEGSANLCLDDTGECVALAVAEEKWRFGPDGYGECAFSRQTGDGGYILFEPSGSCSASVNPVSATTSIRVPLKARSYRRGALRIRESLNTGRLHLTVQLGIEEYLRGIQELPDFWPGSALEAQAIVSRTMAVRQLLDIGSADEFDRLRSDLCACHIMDSDPQQEYGGLTAEVGHPFWQGRVGGTAGQVLTWNNQVISAKFTSSTGGRTESSQAAGDGYLPYLVSVADDASSSSPADNPFSTWTATAGGTQLGSVFGFTWLSNASVASRYESGSVATVVLDGIITGQRAELTVTGAGVRDALGLRSSYFDIEVTPTFGDVLPGHPFGGEILGLNELGITSGCTVELFCPSGEVTRAEMAAFLVRALNLELEDSGDPFTDDDGSFFEAEIETLYASGITTGCTAILFCPSDLVTREQMAAFLVRAFELALPSGDPDTFSDDDGLFFEAEIETLHASGITSGCTATLFCPSDLVTREQMAAFLIRALAV